MPTPLNSCKNCEELFNKEFKFCPYCGQKSKDELTLKLLFYNTLSNYFTYDSRFLKSISPLLFKPGYLASKFIEGKRLLYLHPGRLYLFVVFVFFFLFNFIEIDRIKKMDSEFEQGFNTIDYISEVKEDAFVKVEINETTNSNKYLNQVVDSKIDSVIEANDFDRSNRFTLYKKSMKLTEIDSLLSINAPKDTI